MNIFNNNILEDLIIIKDKMLIDDAMVTEITVNNITYFIYNMENDEFILLIEFIHTHRKDIIKNITLFLTRELSQKNIKTINNLPIIIKNEQILLFSLNKISLHFTYTNIIGALEVGIMVDIEGIHPKSYTLLDDSEVI